MGVVAKNHRWLYPKGQSYKWFNHRRCTKCGVTQRPAPVSVSNSYAWEFQGGTEDERWTLTWSSRDTTPTCPGTKFLAPQESPAPQWLVKNDFKNFVPFIGVCPDCRVGANADQQWMSHAWTGPQGLYTSRAGEQYWLGGRCRKCGNTSWRPIGAAETVYRAAGHKALVEFLWAQE